jgi:hypothetical protein
MGFGLFFRRHPLWSVVGAVGALVSAWGFLGDARDLWTAGMKPEFLQLFGFVVFVASVVAVVARQQQQIDRNAPGPSLPTYHQPPPRPLPSREPFIDPDVMTMLKIYFGIPIGGAVLFLIMATLFRLIGMVLG